MRLAQLKPRMSGRIKGFAEGLKEDFCCRLRELGFCEGASVQLVRAIPFGGPCVFRVCDTVYSIDPEISRQILVEAIGA